MTDNEYWLEISTGRMNLILMLNYSSGTILLNMLISCQIGFLLIIGTCWLHFTQLVTWQCIHWNHLPSLKWPPFLCLDKQKQLQNLEDACDDIMMLDDDDSLLIPYQIGDVFISHSQEETQEMLEEAKVCLGKRELIYCAGCCGVVSIGMG